MNRLLILILFLLPFATAGGLQGKDRKFILVLDPGHGGEDSGARGSKSLEKDINLAVALLAGDMITKEHPDVEIVYTRKKDMTVSLPKRSQIANNVKADLFISIHANATSKGKTIKGAEVFTYGPTKSNANLEVLERENKIVYLEDEFKGMSVADFLNPVETGIIAGGIQQYYHEQSFDVASTIQAELVSRAKRGNRGVKSDNFAVLRNAAMPSVLIELDFISCPEAESYMTSKEGQKTMAQCIFNAFTAYKKKIDLRAKGSESQSTAVTNNSAPAVTAGQRVYKVQIYTSPSPATPARLKGYEADCYIEDGQYKYTIGETTDWDEIQQIRKSVLKDFGDAFIVKFENGERIHK